MCGIFGFISKSSSHSQIKSDINKLFYLTEPRGRQAAGISILRDQKLLIYKRPFSASTMLQGNDYNKFLNQSFDLKSNYTAVLGHCRLVTDGSEIIHSHNQPLITESIVGVHNGVINNFHKIKEENNLQTEGISDSEVLFNFFNKNLKESISPQKALIDTYTGIDGAAAVAMLFNNFKELIISTNFGSLYFCHNEDFFVFASEEKIINDFLIQTNRVGKCIHLLPNTAKSINIENLTSNDFDLKSSEKKLNFTNFNSITFDKTPNPLNIKRCKKCILPINYPFLKLDKDGVCNFCHKYKKQKYHGKDELEKILEKYRSKNADPDCLVGLSGGRDSCYVLHLLKKEFGMNPVAFTYDWLMTSQKARHNIAKMAGALGVEVIYRCGDYETQATNIRNNIYGFLKQPDLSMMTFVQAGDKEMYHYAREIRKEKNLDLVVWGSGFQLEQREFFVGYCGIDKTLVNNPRLYDYGWMTKLRLAVFYGLKTLQNPLLWNRSVYDNFMAFWHCFVAKDDFLYLFSYLPWNEEEIERVLKQEYNWLSDDDYGANQWRMDDFHTAFNNYVYYTVGGFSEFDDFRSNQIREGLISRDQALKLVSEDNNIKYESLLQFSQIVGFNLEHVLKRIDAIPKLYHF